jgi:cytidine deaminase
MTTEELISIAKSEKQKAYAPFSNFRVAAILIAENGKVYTGVNIENSTYGATCCAERTAIFKAVSEGERKFKQIAIISDSDEFTYPCGICRQVMAEFASDDFQIFCSDKNGNYVRETLGSLLPNAFRLKPQ